MKNMPLFLLYLLVSLSCSKSESEGNASNQNDIIAQEVFDFVESLEHDGDQRTYRIHLPPDYYSSPSNRALVLAFHGGGGNAEQFETATGLSDYSDEEGFVVVYPEGKAIENVGTRTWNAGNCCGANSDLGLGTDDVGFVSKLIDRLVADYNVDPYRIYATGQSNGGMLTYRLVCELSDKIAAFAPSSCTSFYEGPCTVKEIPLVHIHSELDNMAPFEGGPSSQADIEYPAAEDHLEFIAGLNDCESEKTLVFENMLYSLYEWKGCTNATVELYLTKDGGHSWAGGTTGFDMPSQAFSANDIIWDFFQQFSL